MTTPAAETTIDQTILRWTGVRGFEATVSSLTLDDKEMLFQTRLRGLVDATYNKLGARRSLGFAKLPAELDDKQRSIIFCRGAEQLSTRTSAVVHVLTGPALNAGVALGLGDRWGGGFDFPGKRPELSGWRVPESASPGLPGPAPEVLPSLDSSELRKIAQGRLDEWKFQARHASFALELTRLVEGLLRAGNDRLAVYECQSDPVVLLAAAREILRTYASDDWSFSTGETEEKTLFRITFLLPQTRAAAVGQYVELDRNPADSQHWQDACRLVDAYQQRSTADWAEDLKTAGVEDRTSLLEWVRTNPAPSRKQLERQLVDMPGLRRQLREQNTKIGDLERLRQADEITLTGLREETRRQGDQLQELRTERDSWRTTATNLQNEIRRWTDESRWLTGPTKRKVTDFQYLGAAAEMLFGLRDQVASWEAEAGLLAEKRSRNAADFWVLRHVAEELLGLRLSVARWEGEARWLREQRPRAIGEFQELGLVAQDLYGLRDQLVLWTDEARRLGDRRQRDAGAYQFQVLGPVAADLFELRGRVARWEEEAAWLLDRQPRDVASYQMLGLAAHELAGLRATLERWTLESRWLADREPPATTEFQVLQPTAKELFGLRVDSQQWQLEAAWLYAQKRPEITEFRMLRRPAAELFQKRDELADKRDELAEWELEAKLLAGRARREITDFVHLRKVAEALSRQRSGQAQLDARAELERWQIEQQWIIERRAGASDAFSVLKPVAAMVNGLISDYASARHENTKLIEANVELQHARGDWHEYAEDLRERLNQMKVAALEQAKLPPPEPRVDDESPSYEDPVRADDEIGQTGRNGEPRDATDLFEAWGIGEDEQPRRLLAMFDGKEETDRIWLDTAAQLRAALPDVLAHADWRGLVRSGWQTGDLDSAFKHLVHLAFGTVASVDRESEGLLRESLRQTFRATKPADRRMATKLYGEFVGIAGSRVWSETRDVANWWLGRLQNGEAPPTTWEQMADEVNFKIPSSSLVKVNKPDPVGTVVRRRDFVAFVQKRSIPLTLLALALVIALMAFVLVVR